MARRFAFLGTLLALAFAAPAAASAGGTILVRFSHPASAAAKVSALGDDVEGSTATGVTVVDPQPAETAAQALARYRARADVEYAEPNRVLHLLDMTPPDDPDYGSQWALGAVSALAGWSSFPGTFSAAPMAPLGIVDTGVDATHEDLAGRISASSATCLGSCVGGIPTDDDGHGTHVSGIAGAATDNGLGVAGLAYASPLIVVRVFPADATQGAALSDVADGILWAAAHGAWVINLSLGATGGTYPTTLCDAVSAATSSYDAVVVAAAGNGQPEGTPTSTPTYPAACPGAIGVAATDSSDLPGSFSNYGHPNVFVSAPGVNVLSTYAGGYAYLSGTSMASPYVTALAALVRSLHPGASATAVRQILALSSDKVGSSPYGADPYGTCAGCTWEQHYGYGRIDVPRALATAVPPPPPPPVPPPPAAPPPPPPPPPPLPDKKPPTVRAYPARGPHGAALRLRYRVSDNAGQTSERILIYRRKKLLKTLARPLRATDDAVAYWSRWRFRAPGAYRFCVRATDGSGNRSRLACAGVNVR